MAQLKLATNTDFKIEKDVPLTGGGHRRAKYPWATMQVGDSFFVPNCTSVKLATSAGGWGLRNGAKFTVRKEGNGARVWRVA